MLCGTHKLLAGALNVFYYISVSLWYRSYGSSEPGETSRINQLRGQVDEVKMKLQCTLAPRSTWLGTVWYGTYTESTSQL